MNNPLSIEQKQTTIAPIAVLAMISESNGIELVSIFEQSVDRFKFESSLIKLREKNQYKKICIFLDNLSVHRSKVVTEKAKELNIPLIYNCPYYPEGNPIELVFAQAKHNYKKEKLQQIVTNKKIYQKVLITNSFKKIGKEVTKRCIKHSRSHMINEISESNFS